MYHRPVSKKFLGTHDAGLRFVDLYARPGGSAEFRMQPGEGKNARIMIGIDDHWWVVFSALVHEIVELTYLDMGLRYVPGPDIANDNGAYAFFMDHTKFSEATARAGLFLASSVPGLLQYWKKKSKNKKED